MVAVEACVHITQVKALLTLQPISDRFEYSQMNYLVGVLIEKRRVILISTSSPKLLFDTLPKRHLPTYFVSRENVIPHHFMYVALVNGPYLAAG
jgi:hypothetical protein